MMTRTELCAWLRANSSGIYRPAADAADEIEQLAQSAASHFRQAMLNGEALQQARAEAEELRQDAERFRKLGELNWWVGDWATYNDKLVEGGNVNASIEALRAAIDAA